MCRSKLVQVSHQNQSLILKGSIRYQTSVLMLVAGPADKSEKQCRQIKMRWFLIRSELVQFSHQNQSLILNGSIRYQTSVLMADSSISCMPITATQKDYRVRDHEFPYFFGYKTEFFPKDLDPSCKMDLDLWDCLGRVKLVL